MRPHLNIDDENDEPDEKWVPNLKFDNCCMARILSKQEDFTNQISMLETVLREAGHLCIFLPKFHCELNPIEMVSFSFIHP